MLTLICWLSVFVSLQSPPSQIIDGYVNTLSAFPGDSIELFLNSRYPNTYNLKLYDLSGKEVSVFKLSVFPQSPSQIKPYENGYGYRLTKKIKVPLLPSGVYLLENHIPLIIKTRNPQIVVVYTSNTINAYCNAGGKSLYGFNSTEKTNAQKVSFLRPLPLPNHSEAFLRWIQKENLSNVGYITDLDLEDYNSIKKASLSLFQATVNTGLYRLEKISIGLSIPEIMH